MSNVYEGPVGQQNEYHDDFWSLSLGYLKITGS